MLPFRNIPIKRKLMIITMATTAAALLLTGVGIVVSDSILFREYLRRDLSALAQMAAENSTAALQFDDPKAAAETLAALHARTHLMAACMYSQDGAIFARYLRPGSSTPCPA